MKKFAFYVSANATRLINFLKLSSSESLIHQIEFVLIDNKNNKILKKICDEKNITFYEVDYIDIIKKNEFISKIFLDYLKEFKIDFAFIFADRILVGNLLKEYKNRLINFHPSLLPSHKGLYAIDSALNAGTFLLGNTAHLVTKELDGGRVVMQNIFPATNFKTYDDVLDNQLIMLRQLMLWIDKDRLIIDEYSAKIQNASYEVNTFIPNIEE